MDLRWDRKIPMVHQSDHRERQSQHWASRDILKTKQSVNCMQSIMCIDMKDIMGNIFGRLTRLAAGSGMHIKALVMVVVNMQTLLRVESSEVLPDSNKLKRNVLYNQTICNTYITLLGHRIARYVALFVILVNWFVLAPGRDGPMVR